MLRTWCEHQLSPLCFMTVRAVWPAFPCPYSHAFPSVSGNPEYTLSFSRCFVGYCVRTLRKGMNTASKTEPKSSPCRACSPPATCSWPATSPNSLDWRELLPHCLWCFAEMFPKIVPSFPHSLSESSSITTWHPPFDTLSHLPQS